jgi:DNA-binding XRE family transcriptional regulator
MPPTCRALHLHLVPRHRTPVNDIMQAMDTALSVEAPPLATVGSDSIAPRSAPDPDLAPVLRRLREQRGLSQEAVARRAGISLNSYARIEGGLANPSWTTGRAIAEALDVTLEELGRLVEAEAPK